MMQFQHKIIIMMSEYNIIVFVGAFFKNQIVKFMWVASKEYNVKFNSLRDEWLYVCNIF